MSHNVQANGTDSMVGVSQTTTRDFGSDDLPGLVEDPVTSKHYTVKDRGLEVKLVDSDGNATYRDSQQFMAEVGERYTVEG